MLKRYTDAFRQTVMSEIVSGKWKSVTEAYRAYGITGTTTVAKWIVKFGYGHLLNRVIIAVNEQPQDELKKLRRELKETKNALADMAVKVLVTESMFDILAEECDTDPTEAKKTRFSVAHRIVEEKAKSSGKVTVTRVCKAVGFSRADYYKQRAIRQSKVVAEALESHYITISMTKEQHCYENGKAERVNGILKLEYGLEYNQLTFENCVKNVN